MISVALLFLLPVHESQKNIVMQHVLYCYTVQIIK